MMMMMKKKSRTYSNESVEIKSVEDPLEPGLESQPRKKKQKKTMVNIQHQTQENWKN